MRVPSHVGLDGNSAAETDAKAAYSVGNVTLIHCDFYPLIRDLNECLETQNRLHAIKPTVNITKSYYLPQRDEVIIHQLRIGHDWYQLTVRKEQ